MCGGAVKRKNVGGAGSNPAISAHFYLFLLLDCVADLSMNCTNKLAIFDLSQLVIVL